MNPGETFNLDSELSRESDRLLAELLGLKYDLPTDEQEVVDDMAAAQENSLEVLSKSQEDLGKLLHDYRNQLTSIFNNAAYLVAVIKEPTLKARLQELDRSLKILAKRVQESVLAQALNLDQKGLENFTLPDTVCLLAIDDSESVLKGLRRIVATKASPEGFNEVHCINGELPKEFPIENAPNVLILLDHNLGKEIRGHMLIERLQVIYPGSLIVCHSGDAASLQADPENPYTKQGIPIVKKFDLTAITQTLKEKGWLEA